MTPRNPTDVLRQMEARMGPSPEDDHIYPACFECGNDRDFIGVDDYGLPGKEDDCDRCDRPALGDDDERCWCPAYVTLEQDFTVLEQGAEPSYGSFTGGGSGSHIEGYTRIYCAGCDELVWLGEEGLGPVVADRIRWDDDLTKGEHETLLLRAIEGDLRGVLDEIDPRAYGPPPGENPVRKAAEALDDKVWQRALEKCLDQGYLTAMRMWGAFRFLRRRTRLPPDQLQDAFDDAMRRNPVPPLVLLRLRPGHVELPVSLTVDMEAAVTGIKRTMGWYNRGNINLFDDFEALRRAVIANPEPLRLKFASMLREHPERALAFREDCPEEVELSVDGEALEGGLLKMLDEGSYRKVVKLLETYEDARRVVLGRELLARLLKADSREVRQRALLLAEHVGLEGGPRKNALGRPEETREREGSPRGREGV